MKTSDTVFRKIYLSVYLKGLCVRGSWRSNRTAAYWPPLLWPSVFLSRFPGLLNQGLGGPASLRAGFLYCILFLTRLIPNWLICNCSIGGLRPHSAGCWLSLPALSPTSLVSKLTDFLSSPSYIIVQRPPSYGRHKLHSFNPSMVKIIISWSTGCTCYLQSCISYFESPAGS